MGQHRSDEKVLTHFLCEVPAVLGGVAVLCTRGSTEVLEQPLPAGHCHWLLGEQSGLGSSAVQCGAH